MFILRKKGEIYKLQIGLHAEPQGVATFLLLQFYEARALCTHKICTTSSSYR